MSTKKKEADIVENFLVCQDVRTEANGLVSIMGSYNRGIKANTVEPVSAKHPLVMPRFAIFLTIFPHKGKDGFRKMSVSLVDPKGDEMMATPLEKMEVRRGKGCNIVLGANGIEFSILGKYKVIVTLGNKQQTKIFTIDQGSPPTS